MLVYTDGTLIGTVGGGELENRVIKAAVASLRDGKAQTLAYTMADPSRGDPGVCGGQERYLWNLSFLRQWWSSLVQGMWARQSSRSASGWDSECAAVHDWLEFCTPETTPGADVYYPVTMEKLAEQLAVTNQTYLVVTSRGSGVDAVGLPSLLASKAAYIGVIGSKEGGRP